MQAKNLLMWGAGIVGGYFILKDMFGYDILANFGVTPATTGTSPQASNPAVTAAATTLQKISDMVKASGGDPSGYQSVDFWNYNYKLVRGIDGPAPEALFPNVDRNKTYSLTEWWSAMTGAGFSGLGMVVSYPGFGIGRDIVPDLSGFERMNKRFN
jgi:hypothetical protein